MTDEQALSLARLMRDRPNRPVSIVPGPFDLPDGYVLVTFDPNDRPATFVCGIAPDGRVSS